jgi:hypothetical protein
VAAPLAAILASSAIRLDDQRPRGHPADILALGPSCVSPTSQLKRERSALPEFAWISGSDPKAPPKWQELEAAGRELGVNVVAENVSTPDDLDGVFQALARQRVDVLIVLQTSMLISERRKIAALAAATRPHDMKSQLPAWVDPQRQCEVINAPSRQARTHLPRCAGWLRQKSSVATGSGYRRALDQQVALQRRCVRQDGLAGAAATKVEDGTSPSGESSRFPENAIIWELAGVER